MFLFTTLRKHNLKVAAKKCNLFRSKITFLGFIISAEGVRPDPAKVILIVDDVITRNIQVKIKKV